MSSLAPVTVLPIFRPNNVIQFLSTCADTRVTSPLLAACPRISTEQIELIQKYMPSGATSTLRSLANTLLTIDPLKIEHQERLRGYFVSRGVLVVAEKFLSQEGSTSFQRALVPSKIASLNISDFISHSPNMNDFGTDKLIDEIFYKVRYPISSSLHHFLTKNSVLIGHDGSHKLTSGSTPFHTLQSLIYHHKRLDDVNPADEVAKIAQRLLNRHKASSNKNPHNTAVDIRMLELIGFLDHGLRVQKKEKIDFSNLTDPIWQFPVDFNFFKKV